MKFFHTVLLTAAVLLLCGGCGYRIGTMGHPQLKNIAVAAVKNDTTVYNLSHVMRNVLSEQYMLDGTLKVVSEKKADCIVYVRIVDVSTREITTKNSWDNDDNNYEPEEWQMTVRAEYSVIIPGRKEPLIPLRTVTGTAQYQARGDMDTASRQTAAQACRECAQMIVEFTTEAW